MLTCQSRRNYAGHNGLQDTGSRSSMFPIRVAGAPSFCTTGVTTKPAEWPDNYDPFRHAEEIYPGFGRTPRQNDEDDRDKPAHRSASPNQDPNGKPRDRSSEGPAVSPRGGILEKRPDRKPRKKPDERARTKTPGNKKPDNKGKSRRLPKRRGQYSSDSDEGNSSDASGDNRAPFPSRPYGGNGGGTKVKPKPNKPAERSIADPIMLPYSTVYYPAGPCGPRIQICPYVPLCWC